MIALALLSFAGSACGQTKVALAYAEGGVVYLVADSGAILQSVKASLPIYEFAVAPDAQSLVFDQIGANDYGGPLYLVRVATGETARLTPPTQKVYSDPGFSPNGDRIVFAIHAHAKGDLVEGSGPLGTMDVRTRAITILAATANIGGNGAFFSNEPHWSPDGKRILFSFEAGAALVDAGGKDLKELAPSGGDWSHAIGWLGSNCAVYIAGRNQKEAMENPVRVLNLGTGKSELATQILGLPNEGLKGLVAFSPKLRVRAIGTKLLVEGGSHTWELPVKNANAVTVRIVPQSDLSNIPGECR